ncbi:MAG: dynamin family protein, partial [Synergistaceae bacterium]|nr:dynamin family protein [Synergistaceae bacterium]
MNVREALEKLKNINESHGLSNDDIIVFLDGFGREFVPVPVIGAFSSGKSSILNTLLGYSGGRKLLPEDITPETAIPAELQYEAGEDSDNARITFTDGTEELVPFKDYLENKRAGVYEAEAARLKIIRFLLNNGKMARLPKLLLVDMPGFGSGDVSHEKAIDGYVERAMAYIVTFPADGMALTTEVGAALRELCVHGKPIRVMITKKDKAPIEEDFDKTRAVLEKNLKRYIDGRDIEWIETDSHHGDASELLACLEDLNDRAGEMMRTQKYLPFLREQAALTLTRLKGAFKLIGLSESELKENAETMAKEMREHEDNMRRMTDK